MTNTTFPLTIPKLGLTMTDCTLVSWLKENGDKVSKGEIIYTIETDKIATDVEADSAGFLQRIAEPDTLLEVGSIVGYLHETSEDVSQAAANAGPISTTTPNPAVAVPDSETAEVMTLRVDLDKGQGRILISPVARRLAAQAGLDISVLSGTGPGSAILKCDIEKAIEASEGLKKQPDARLSSSRVPTNVNAHPSETSRKPLSPMRRTIAKRMMQSLQGSAQMTGFGRIDMAEVVRFRASCLEAEDRLGARITYTDILIKAAATVLSEMPQVNASIIDDEIVSWGTINVGLAIALDEGLIVPIIPSPDKLTLPDISLVRQDLVDKARNNQLSRTELQGGTFSLSNFGSYGGDFETPILNPPQSALLGIGQITDEPVVRDGEIVIRPMMSISMTVDHRLIDGATSGKFRGRLKELLEKPALWLAALR